MAKQSSKIIPLHDKVLIDPQVVDEKTASGIIIPDTVDKEKPEQGTVVAVGDGAYDDGKKVPMTVKVGDTVLFSKYGYDEVKIDDTEYYIIEESKILAIIK